MLNKVIIIGSGCAGLTSAIYLGRADFKPLLFTGNLNDKGGLLTKTHIVENFPGFNDGIEGYDLICNMTNQAEKYGAKIVDNEIVKVDFSKKPYVLYDDENKEYKTETIIIATGSKPNKLNLPNEENLWSKGISSCAVCDGALYRNKKIVVVGGGDSALTEAEFLTKFSDVTLIHRRDAFRGTAIMQKRILENKKITVLYNTVITEIIGDKKLENIKCKDLITDKIFTLDVDGLFYGLGLQPNTSIFKNQIDMDDEGYIKHIGSGTSTSKDGIFAAGDCVDKVYKQACTASGEGCKAAIDIDRYLSNK